MNNLPACCTDMEIAFEDLLFPERLNSDGFDFITRHGVYAVPLGRLLEGATETPDGKVRILHRCDQLGDDGRCKIYAMRPKICKEFDCQTRSDCACHGKGIIE